MKNKNINNVSPNNLIIKENKEKQENSSFFKSKIIMEYDYNIKDLNVNMTISELKKDINKRLNHNDNEYKLFIGDNSIKVFPDSTSILFLLNEYKSNKIDIKSYKNIFDCTNEINCYENNLTKKISSKDDEIKKLNIEYETIKKDLNDP